MIDVRTMRPEEVDAVCRVDREAFRDGRFGELNGLREMTPAEFEQWQSVKDFREYIGAHPERVIVAVEGADMGGFAIWHYNEETKTGRVYSCALMPAFRGKGLAGTLLKRLLDAVRDRGAERVTVSTTHEPKACAMYEKAGFRLVARRTKAAPNGTPYDCSDYELVF